jgi:protein LSM14
VHTAAASLETVERALGDLRVSNSRGGGSSGRRGGGGTTEIKVPSTDFDFQSSNAKFDKTAIAPKKKKVDTEEDEEDEQTNPSDTEANGKEKEKEKVAYNPQKSFFDSLSSSAHAAPSGHGNHHRGGGERGGERGGRGRGGRNRREEERERNVATFGEPGGVGLMGPGAYVGGWGGYGRRGGRPRRGSAAVGSR